MHPLLTFDGNFKCRAGCDRIWKTSHARGAHERSHPKENSVFIGPTIIYDDNTTDTDEDEQSGNHKPEPTDDEETEEKQEEIIDYPRDDILHSLSCPATEHIRADQRVNELADTYGPAYFFSFPFLLYVGTLYGALIAEPNSDSEEPNPDISTTKTTTTPTNRAY